MSAVDRSSLLHGRNQTLYRLQFSYGVNFVAMIGVSWMILAYSGGAGTAGRLLLALISVSVTLFAALSIPTIIREIEALKAESPSGMGSAYDAWMESVPLSLFSVLTVAANVAVCAAQLWTIFA